MDHRHALETQAAECYLLGELSAEEAEEFELHYFECQMCAGAVESGGMFIDGARGAWSAPAHPAAAPAKKRAGLWESLAAFWQRPVLPFAVAAVLAVFVLYQNFVVIPDMRTILNTARSLPAVQLIGVSRGEPLVVTVPPHAPFVSLAADIPPDKSFEEYICVLSLGDREISNSVNPAPSEGQPITVLIPSTQLTNGSHELTLYGRGPHGERSDKISTYPFTVQLQQR